MSSTSSSKVENYLSQLRGQLSKNSWWLSSQKLIKVNLLSEISNTSTLLELLPRQPDHAQAGQQQGAQHILKYCQQIPHLPPPSHDIENARDSGTLLNEYVFLVTTVSMYIICAIYSVKAK